MRGSVEVWWCILVCLWSMELVEAKPKLVCDQKIRRVEKECGIPDYLLCAITHVESGSNRPPWLLNANGFPFTLESKEQAVSAVNVLQDIGLQSIDVGPAQINLKHHPKAFTTLENAFEPDENLTYAAKFLLDLKKRRGTWEKAICAYHSSTPELGARYKKRVMRAWFAFLGKEPSLGNPGHQKLVMTHQKRLLKSKKTLAQRDKSRKIPHKKQIKW